MPFLSNVASVSRSRPHATGVTVRSTSSDFPPEAIRREYFQPSERTSVCHWKGTARYCDVVVGGAINPAAAWTYPEPKDAAANIKDHVAFWNGVEVDA